MKHLLDELHRRSLWQVLGLYLAGSWMVLQVVDVIGSNFGLPDWVAPSALALLIVGLPIVLLTAFVQHGIRKPPEHVTPPEVAFPEQAASLEAAPTSPARAAGWRKLFTWKRALLGGAAAFALLAAGATAWLVMRSAGIGPAGTLVARGDLEDRALVVLADFASDDPSLSAAATEALRVDLSQSGTIRLAEPSQVEEALQRMGRDPEEDFSADLAREVGVREGAGAVISGRIDRAGSGFVFSAQMVSVGDGAVLTSQRETAAGEEDVIPAIDRLSEKLRERVGDSYRSIGADPPLRSVTTTSLEALKLYSKVAEGDVDRTTLLEQAVELDSTFAMAWRALGIEYRNRRTNRAAMVDAFTRAFEHRDHLTEIERRKTASMYYITVDPEPRLAAAELDALLELVPDDYGSVVNLGVLSSSVGDHERSAEYSLRAIALQPGERGPAYWNAVTSLVNAGRLDEAQAIVDSVARTFDEPGPRMRTMVLAARGQLEEAEGLFREALTREDMNPGWRAWLGLRLAQFAAARGRAEEAERETRIFTSFVEEIPEDGALAEYFEGIVQAAWTDVVVRQRPEKALDRISEALERHPLDELDPRDRPYLEIAEVVARAGDHAWATRLVDEMRSSFEQRDLKRLRTDLHRVQGEIALAEARPRAAVERFHLAFENFCHICPLPGLALAYEAAGQPDSAIAAHTRYVETPYSDRFLVYSYPLGQALAPTHERLGELLERAGRPDEAARHYARFIELWEDADPELQPRVRAARLRLGRILEERG